MGFSRLVLVALGISGGMASPAVFGGTFLVKTGKPQAEIIVADKPARMAKLAASNLQEYVFKMTGAKLAITNVPGADVPVKIYVGKSAHTDRLNLATEGLAHGAFRMASGKDWLALLGPDKDFVPMEPYAHGREWNKDKSRAEKDWDAANPGEYYGFPYYQFGRDSYHSDLDVWEQDDAGTMNAVCEFLRSLGVRWYFPGELGEVVPKMASIALPTINETVKPDFPMRRFGYWRNDKDNILWNLRMGVNFGHELMGLTQNCHGSKWVYMRDEVKKAHPDWYALWGGKRATDHSYSGAPCLSSEGLFQQHLKFARMMFDVRKEPMLSLDACDGYGSAMCGCDLCKGKDTVERGWEGNQSDYVWNYVNRVAAELYKTHPDHKVSGLSYSAYTLPPEKIDKLSPNLALVFCQSRGGFNDRERREKVLKLRQAWLAKLTLKEMYIYEYYLQNCPHYGRADIPVYFPRLIAEDLRSLKGVSMGDMIEVYRHSDPKQYTWDPLATMHLNVYVTARLWWDADQDLDAMLNEYYKLFYGPAEQEMKEFVEYSENNWPLMNTRVEPIDKAQALLATARAKAGDTIYGKRIEMVIACLEPLRERREKLAVGRKGAPQALAAERKSADLKLDGQLDESFWKDVPVHKLKGLVSGNLPKSETTFQVAWGDKAIIFGIRCEEADMKKLNARTLKNEDPSIFNDDNIELLLETQTHAYYQMAINAAGKIMDLDRKDDSRNSLWSSEAAIAVFKGADFWSLEVKIPTADLVEGGIDALKKVEGTKPVSTAPWYFNLCRSRARGEESELSAFSPTGKPRFNEPAKFGELIVK
jgi:hypothetical protein